MITHKDLNYHYYKYLIFQIFQIFIKFHWARKVGDESKWLLGVGPVFKEHRTHAFFGQDERPV